jgi:MATE family multidrug resistance protein
MTVMVAKAPTSRAAWGAEISATLALAWPIVLTNVAQVGLATTDVVMMGWLGPDALAAGALAVNLNFAFLIFAIGLVTATAPLMAIELGRKRHSVRDVRRTIRQGFWAAIAITVPIWAVLWQCEAIFLLLGQQPAIAAKAATYLHTFQWSFLPFLFYLILRNFVSALERPLAALWVGGSALVLNAVLVWTLMFGHLGLPALGLPGAGIGTTVTNIYMAGALALLITLDRRFRRYHLFGRLWRQDWPRFRAIWRIGVPIGVTLAFEATIFNAATFLMGIIGAAALAAHAIAIQIPSLTFMVPLGLSTAATVRVGRAFGAKDIPGISRAGWSAFGIALVYACGTATLILAFRDQLVGLFLDWSDPADAVVAGIATSYLLWAGIFQIVDSAQVTGAGMLRGLGDTRVPMWLAGLGYWGLGLPVGVVLAFWVNLAGIGIWIGLSLGLASVAMLMTVRWARRERLGLTRRAPPDQGSARPATAGGDAGEG